MSELHSWLSIQHHGLQTYKFLKQKLIGRADADPEHAAQFVFTSATSVQGQTE
jgi:hypothetical protein